MHNKKEEIVSVGYHARECCVDDDYFVCSKRLNAYLLPNYVFVQVLDLPEGL